MILNCEDYRVNIADIKTFLGRKTDKQRVEMIGSLAVATNVPIIIVCCFVRELYGELPGLRGLQDSLMKFYRIEQVEGERR